MTYTNLKIVNELGGIQAQRTSDGIYEYLKPGSAAHAAALAGNYGDVAPYEPPEEPDEESLRAEWRETATLSRAKFCLALKREGILPEDEAVDAAKGNWPASFTSAMEGLDVDVVEAQIIWASVSTIYRNDPVLAAVAEAAGVTPEEVDAIFGWGE